jgi:hypothetical protein
LLSSVINNTLSTSVIKSGIDEETGEVFKDFPEKTIAYLREKLGE